MLTIGGIYHPAWNKIIASKPAQWTLWTYTTLTFLYLALIPLLNTIHFLFFEHHSLFEVIMDLMIISSGLQAAAPVAWFMMRHNQFGRLFALWDDYFGADSNAIEREAHFQAHYKRFKKSMYYFSAMAALALNPWMFSQYFEEDKTTKVPTPIPYRHESPYYELYVTFHVYPSAIHTFTTATIHILMTIPEIWVLSELERLKLSLRGIFKLAKKNDQLESTAFGELAVIDRKLSIWIDQHQKLKHFQHEAGKLLWVPYSFEIWTSFMAAWLLAFNFVQQNVGVQEKLTGVFMFTPYVLMFVATCSFCDRVKEESENIIDEAYLENWTALPIKYRKSFIIIAQQARHPFIVKGFKIFPTGYFTLAQILQSAYSMFNFLLASTNRPKAG